jgi:hypothetical protein
MCKTLFIYKTKSRCAEGWPTPLGGILPPPVGMPLTGREAQWFEQARLTGCEQARSGFQRPYPLQFIPPRAQGAQGYAKVQASTPTCVLARNTLRVSYPVAPCSLFRKNWPKSSKLNFGPLPVVGARALCLIAMRRVAPYPSKCWQSRYLRPQKNF